MNKFVKILLIVLIIVSIIGIGFLGYGYYQKLTKNVQNPIATIEVENFGTIKIELYPDMAPNTVTNFITLANRGFYDGKTFHRTIPDFMIQGGSKDGNGQGDPTLSDIKDGGSETETYAIKGEFIANDYDKNTLKLKKGVIAMARLDYSDISSSLTKNGYDSAGSQFFIMNEDNDNINGLYAGFGQVIEGLEIVDQIANVEVITRDSSDTGNADKPTNPPVITSIRVETYGVDYGEPETIEPFNYYNWLMKQYSSSSSEE
ncbi:MAG: peptidylprolyl isomerase [Clostridia bacterium]